MSADHSKLCIVSFGVALAFITGFSMMFMGIAAWSMGWGVEVVDLIATLYVGYAPNLKGIIIGTVWGIVDGFIAGVIIAWVYNWTHKHCPH